MGHIVGMPGSRVFGGSPSGLGNIWDWWEPSLEVGLNDSDPIQTLNGQVNNRDWTQGTLGSRPLYDTTNALNGHAVATFNTSRFWTGPDMTGLGTEFAGEAHVFIVVKCDADPAVATDDGGLWELSASSSTGDFYTLAADGKIYASMFRKNRINTAVTPDLSSWRVYEAVVRSSSAPAEPDGKWSLRVDGTEINAGTVLGFSALATPRLGINEGGFHFKGKMAGMYLFDGELSGGDRTDLINYINTRFGLSSA